MRVNKEDFELLKKISEENIKEKKKLLKLISKLEEQWKKHIEYNRVKNNEMRKIDKFYGRSKKEIERYKKVHEKDND